MIKIFIKIKNKLINLFYLRSPINIFAGHKIYGNDSGFVANFVGNLIIKQKRKFQHDTAATIDSTIESKVFELKDNGYTFPELQIKTEIVKKINDEFNSHTKKLKMPADGRLEASSINNVGFYQNFESVKSIFNSEMLQIIQNYYNAGFKILNTHIYRTVNVLKDDNLEPYGSTEFWHNDGSTVDSLKIFVLLNDTDENNGPMHIINKNETIGTIKNGFSKYKEGVSNGIIEKKCNIIKFVGKAGKVLIANTNLCLHRGDMPKPNLSRDMLVFYISISNTPFRGIIDKESIKEQFYGFKRLLN